MLIKVQFQKQSTEVVVEGSTGGHDVRVDDLADAIQTQLDVPVHQQKLIVKGKLLVKGDPLAKYGVKDGAKVMLMASGTLTQVQSIRCMSSTTLSGRTYSTCVDGCDATSNHAVQGQIAARQQAELRREKAQQRMHDRSQPASTSLRVGPSDASDVVAAADRQSMPQRIKRWKATGIISLRGLQLATMPEGFQQHLEALGPTTIASLYAVDVGNNSLDQLPGAALNEMACDSICIAGNASNP